MNVQARAGCTLELRMGFLTAFTQRNSAVGTGPRALTPICLLAPVSQMAHNGGTAGDPNSYGNRHTCYSPEALDAASRTKVDALKS